VEGTQYVTKESILRRAQEIKGIPLRDVDKTGRLATWNEVPCSHQVKDKADELKEAGLLFLHNKCVYKFCLKSIHALY